MNKLRNRLIREARRIWEDNEPIPIDLFAQLLELGVNVEAMERKYLRYE